MKNRQKLADDQLDAVSGGKLVDIEAEDLIQKLDRKICPGCGKTMADTTVDSIPALHCSLCQISYTKNSGHWQKFAQDDVEIKYAMSC